MLKNTLRQLRHRFRRPFMVMFETTLHCNMKCGYCAIWQNQQPEDRAVRERVFARMDEAADFGVFAWSFSGGEPLMNPNVPAYIEYREELPYTATGKLIKHELETENTSSGQ